MAKITFEFGTRAELDAQLRDFLGVVCADVDFSEHNQRLLDAAAACPKESVMVEPVQKAVEPTVQVAQPVEKAIVAPVEPVPPVANVKSAVVVESAGATVSAPAVTLDNLTTAPYDTLLAFCKTHNVAGVDVEKNISHWFRKMVEYRIQAFLATK